MIHFIYDIPPRRRIFLAFVQFGLLSTFILLTSYHDALLLLPMAMAFTPSTTSSLAVRASKYYYSSSYTSSSYTASSSSSRLHAMNKRTGKFNKQKDLAAKMAEAKRQRELLVDDATTSSSSSSSVVASTSAADSSIGSSSNRQEELVLSAEDIKLRNDRQRFADLLENSLSSGGGGDFDRGYYLTVEQENENADAVCKSITLHCFHCIIFVFYEIRNLSIWMYNMIFTSSSCVFFVATYVYILSQHKTEFSLWYFLQFEVSPVSTREIPHPPPPSRNYWM